MPDFHSEDPHATDVFGGAGGWDVAARQLGLNALGVEWDAAACMTRRAAGLLTVEGDVRDFHPLDFDRVPGFIASPPCQTFSAAGKGAGRAALDTVYQLTKTLEAASRSTSPSSPTSGVIRKLYARPVVRRLLS
ncbi:DNA cytosine methyltransferase [Amycolatopsis vastitatis]|uniref:Uncharacterized protein n=1 Tax=Amycolatopsis vastitatis TaxID=1905142 RepID=A0A229SRC9_9PSEU|nr:DNA cytosine methyltransferase [Amycolatopsis vastitatis]OXM61373.1 hypothetical protein CF165_38510 [Amycolatopsis vastitatis]